MRMVSARFGCVGLRMPGPAIPRCHRPQPLLWVGRAELITDCDYTPMIWCCPKVLGKVAAAAWLHSRSYLALSYLVDGRKQPGLIFMGVKQGSSSVDVDVCAAQRCLYQWT